MRLFIDCEFDGGGGDLISLALVAEDGREFYEVLPCHGPTPWVAKNVMPILGKEPISLLDLQSRLHVFLAQFDAVEIVADHPADIHYFCEALILDTMGTWIPTPPLTLRIEPHVNYESAIPHNALEDARAIKATLAPKEPS